MFCSRPSGSLGCRLTSASDGFQARGGILRNLSAKAGLQSRAATQPLWNNLKHEHGPFDIIGDVHGCFDELHALLAKLGYQISEVNGDSASRHFEAVAAS
jgi:hypothetical protein